MGMAHPFISLEGSNGHLWKLVGKRVSVDHGSFIFSPPMVRKSARHSTSTYLSVYGVVSMSIDRDYYVHVNSQQIVEYWNSNTCRR